MELDWDKLVEERNAWVAHNFPNARTPLDSVLGCIEEVGELTHAHLKQAQSIRGTDEQHVADAKDAIGDLTVYLLGVMSFHGVRPGPVPRIDVRNADIVVLRLAAIMGKLAFSQEHPDTTKYNIVARVSLTVKLAERYCVLRGWDYSQIVQSTWDAVKQRDWILYPDTGLPPPVGSEDNPILVEVDREW